MGHSLWVCRVGETIYENPTRFRYGWAFSEGEHETEYLPFNRLEVMNEFVADAVKLLPKSSDDFGSDLSDEWIVALTLLRRQGSEADYYVADSEYNQWKDQMFDSDDGDEKFDEWQELVGELQHDDKFQKRKKGDPAVRLMNTFLYLAKAPVGVQRAAQKFGFTCRPGAPAASHLKPAASTATTPEPIPTRPPGENGFGRNFL